MFNRRNPMKYFSGNAFARLPLYKLAAGGTAVLLAASVGLGAMAAGFAPLAEPEPTATPTPVPSATAEPTPEPTPEVFTPEVPADTLEMEVSAVQQDIGIQLYCVAYPDAPEFDTQEDADAWLAEAEAERSPLQGVAAVVTVTDADGSTAEYEIDPESGTALAEDQQPGDYTVAVKSAEGFDLLPEAQTVTVKEKVVYKADVQAVKEKIVQASEVNESAEDSGTANAGSAPIANEVTDTVRYAESSKEDLGSSVTYTGKVSDNGYLLLSDGTESPYRPVYEDGTTNLLGAVRDEDYTSADGTAALGLDSSIVPLAGAKLTRVRHQEPESTDTAEAESTAQSAAEAAATETPAPTEAPTPTPEPTVTPTPTPEPTAEPTPTPTPEPTAEPTATPTPEPTATPTPEPTATPTPEPTATPTPEPTETPDPTADWPDEIDAADLADYGFDVTKNEGEQYLYTGWQEIDGYTYYYDPDTHEAVTGSQVIQGNVYTFGADGALNSTARGIDVSKFQGTIDWNAVKADGITFAIIRCGYRGYGSGALVEDATYRQNIQGAISAGLKVGVYFYSQAINEEEAVEEASMVLSLVSGYSLPMGVYYDTEYVAGGRANALSASERTACAVAFCETISNSGYTPGVYSYASWFYNSLNFANISKYRTWIAQYRDTLSFSYKYNIWQYTGSGSVNGISKPVDMNIG